MADQDLDTLSNEELDARLAENNARLAELDAAGGNDAGQDLDSLSDAELDARLAANNARLAELDGGGQGAADAPQGDGYGFTDRQRDQIAAEGGRKAYTGQEYVEGLAPLTRAMRQGRERDEDKELGAWLSDGDDNTLRVALGKHGAARDPSLEGYKAKETGGFWEGVGDDLSRNLAQLPLGAGWLFRKAREADNPQKYATDHLMQSAFLSGFSRADIEQAKEVSQGDPAKMYDFFAERAEKKLKGFAAERQGAQERLAAHADEEGTLSKVAGGALGMIPMIEEFALGGAAGKAVTGATKLGRIAKTLPMNTWRGRVAAGLIHGVGTTAVLGPEMARRRFNELTADEYQTDENGELQKIEGDSAGRALPKAILGGLGEAAIFSMPIGEAAFGWATPMITKALRTKVGNTVANMYTNYVKYGQMTGLRGQPQMLALMDLNAFKDEVMGLGKKDADYEGFDEEWKKFTYGEDLPDGTHVPGTLSLKGQADLFISALGVMALQGGAAGVNAWRHGRTQKASYDRLLRGAFDIPQEQLDKMEPELKKMLVRMGDKLYSGEDAFGRNKVRMEQGRMHGKQPGAFEERLRRWCDKVGAKLGKASGEVYDEAGKYALQFDNSFGWEKEADTATIGGITSRFKIPQTTQLEEGEDGKVRQTHGIPWVDQDVDIGDGRVVRGQAFIDPNTGISVLKYLQTDAKGGDNGYVYLITDENGHRATRFGTRDAMDAARAMDVVNQRNASQRNAKAEAMARIRDSIPAFKGTNFVLAKDGAEFDGVLSEIEGRPVETGAGARGVTLPDGRVMLCLDRIANPQQMKDTMLHEVGRHKGIDAALPEPADKMGFLAGLARSGDPMIQAQLNRIVEARRAKGERVFGKPIESAEDLFKTDKDGNYDPNAANALEEVFAHMFDRGDAPEEAGWWDAHMNAIRGNLRKVFHGMSYNRAEAEAMYRGAMEKLAEQTGGKIIYEPEATERERMVQEAEARKKSQRAGHEAERDVADLRETLAEAERAGAQAEAERRGNEELAERVQEDVREEERLDRADPFLVEQMEKDRKEQVERRIAREQAAAKQRKAAAQANEAARQQAAQDRFNEELERREERKRQGYEAARQEEAEAEAAAQERGKQAQEREEQKRAGYESADEQARLDRKNAIKTAFREGDARQAEEYDRAEAERKAREAAEEAAPLPDITVVDAEPQGKGRTAPQNDVVRVNYGAEDGREGHQIVARRVTDDNGRVIGWDVNAVAKDGTETLIASTTKPKKDGEAAIRAVRRQIHEHFGLPYGRAQKEAMEAERRRVEESETRKEPVDETRNVRDEEPAQPKPEVRDELPAEGEEPRPADEGSAEAQGGEPIVVHHANEGREGDGVEAANDFLAGMFEDATTETPVEAPVAAPREEGAITPPRAAEGAEGGKSASGGDSSGFDFAAFDRINANRDPSTQFFDVNEELSPERRDENWRLVQGIAAMYDQKRIRGFYDFAKYMQRVNPAWYAEQKDGLRRLWNYAAETTDLFDRVGDYEARDAIRSVDEGRNVRDISAINALEAALQDIDVEMYPAAQLDRSDARVPNTKLAADPKSGIVPGNELKGRPRGLLSKPILGVEFEDGTVSVGTGRHRAELYARYGMDIPMRRVREADGWVTKKPDGSYDFTKIRLLDALDNIQDSKGTIEDYVAFFGDVKIPRAAAESEGFLGSKEARLAYALANDAHPDVRAAVNFEGGKVDGTVKPEQAAAIAEIAPIGAAPENDGLQHHLLKAALKDHTLDKRDLQIKASEALQMLRAKRNRDGFEQMGFEFLGDEDVQSAAERAEKYRAEKAAEYSRLAKSFREVQRAKEGDLVKKKITRDDLRALGINERKIAAGGKERQDELQRAIDKAVLEKMRWESINLDPDLRAQMEKDLGIAPKEPDFALESVTADQLKKEAAAQAQRDAVKKGLEAPLKGDGQVNVQPEMDLGQTGQQDLFSPIAETPAQSSAKVDFKRGDHVFLKGAAENQSITFLKANADGTADVQVKTPGANRYMPNKVETRSVPLGDISSTGMKDVLTDAERKRLAEGMASQRFFNAAEEVTPERNRDYADWLKKYRMADTPDRRREWARKNPDKARRNFRFMDADEERRDFEARQYTPAKYKIPGAVKSSTLLEEPPALRATEPPDNDYKLHIPESIIRNGDLQEHQAEFVGYAGKSHETIRPDGTRLGMMGGYGTGAGKSRMIAGIILDNRNQGRKRALWITTQSGLIDDVRSESKPFGMDGMVSDIFGGKDVSVPKDGIGFGTYHGLRQDGIVEKIAQQLGKDFDGVIAFDEIHRAKTEGGRTQDAVVKLQELLPKARVVYMSATGATDVGNLGYGQRLGLWGEGTAFKDFEDFKKKVEGKGVSAMEMVAQTLKRRGQYLSANLSKEGVEFDHVAVPTTDAQKRTYAEYNGALKDVYKGVYDALEALGRLDYTVPPSSLHGMQQRLHYSMVTALKLPVLIERAKQELAKGNVPVFSLVNTNEAGSTREVAKALEEGRRLGMDEVNFGPKQILLDFLTKEGDKTYNKVEGAYRDYQFPTMKPVKDQSGEVIGFERDPVADGIRRRLVREVEKLPDDFGNPINMIVDAFGKDNVANLTGLNRDGMAADYRAFQDGGKKVLVFSGVANTGYTFSSDRKYKNQARRVLFPLQLGYRADELEQTLGRVHRNNQANAPIYIASTTDLPGERRFYSSVERRRGQMKALTTGDRTAGGNGITNEGDNFETKYAQQAVDGIIAALHRMGKLDEIAREMNFIKRTQRADGSVVEVNGMLKRDKGGAILPNVPAKRFLNRLLMLDPKRQDAMFSAFKSLLDQNIRWAKEDGEYDIGLQDIGSTRNDAVRSVKLADDMEVGHVNSWFKTDKVPFDDFARDHAAEFLTYVRNKRTGETFAVRADGKMGRKQEPAAMRYAVDGTKKRMRASILDTEKPNSAYERLDTARAKELWDAEYGVIPDERADDGFYAHGDLLRHWTDVLGSKPPRTFRVKAGDAPEYIGAKIDADEIPAIFGRFGKAEEARDMVIDGKVREVLNNRTVDLVNGWTLKQVPRDGAKKVMVRGVEPEQLDAVAKELGGEVSKKRIFMEPDAAKLRKIIEEHPANLYRDDEKIGDTGNLRFFNIDEEAGRRVHAKDYDEALRMEGAGAGRREIWEKTGWWKGKDGKWRYEIPGISQADTQSMLDAVFTSGKFRDRNKANVYTFTLNDLEKELKDKGESLPTSVKTLLKAYPKLGKESIEVDRAAEQPKDGTLGYATKGTIHLYERGTTAETLNHELQHRIQAASGMAGGTNTDGKSFDRYTHEHGEWEARQAATRADMTAEQRDKTAPWETADRHGVAEDATLIDDANRARIRPDGEPPEPEPAAPAMDRKTGIGEKAKTELMDRYDPIKKMEIETGRRGKKDLFVEKSPYNAMRQLHGHNEAARQRYEKIWKRPFEEMLRKSGVGLDDVGMYLIAMNAKDRNRKVLNRTGALDGAGMSDADADKALADLRSFLGADKMRKIEDMANFLWKMQKEGMERRVESGRVSRETADLWEQEEPHHVPMRDDLSDEDGDYNRSTRRWTRNDYHPANGRYTLPDNPVEFMFKEYQDAMYGSNINEARRALADFVRSTPGVGKIRRGVRRGKAWSFTHGQIEDFPDPNYREQTVKGGPGRPNLVSFKEGGDLYMIELNGKQGERVAEAVIGRGVRRVEDFLPTLAKINRAYASTATEYSLTFLGRNAIADMIEASLNTMADKGLIRGSASAVKNIVNAFRMMGTIKAYVNKGRFEGAFADAMRRYVESGALIGGMGNEGITEMKRDLGKVASGKYGVMDVVKFVGRTISNINKRGELATRLAVFKDYIDGGASDGEAAMRSREYSTDFNKYGNQRWMNTTWMFSGSVIGGAVRQTASLVQGKAGKQLATALFAYGVAEALAEHFFNSDDDEKGGKSGQPSGATMTEYQRANSLYFRMGDKYIRAPFHAGPFSVLKYAGNIVARAAMGDISWSEAGKHMAGEGVDNIMHFTGTGDFNHETIAQSLAPTLLVPFLQLKANEDFAGRPIRKQMFSETKPYSENGRKGTGDIWKAVARGANALGGGNERRRGVEWLDNSPEAYRHVVADSLLKNLGRDVATVFDFVTDMCEGKSVFETDKTHRLFMRDYYRDVPDNTQNFYEAEKAYNADRADGTIKPGSRRDEAVKKLLRDIATLRHWEDGEEKVGSRWVKRRNPSETTKEKHKKMRLRYQQRVIEIMRRKK